MKSLNLSVLFLLLLTDYSNSQSLILSSQDGNCPTSNSLFVSPNSFLIKNWDKLEWFNDDSIIRRNHRLFKSSLFAGVTTNIGNASNTFFFPERMYRDSSGVIYVLDYGNQRVQKWLPNAVEGITVAGGNGRGSASNQLNEPSDLFIDMQGNIYIADSFNNRIQKWAPGATFGTTVAVTLNPRIVHVDNSGDIYTTNVVLDGIIKFTPDSPNGVLVAGGKGYGLNSDQLKFPSYIYIDQKGDLIVSDAGNHRIQRFSSGSTSGITIAGGNGQGSSVNQLNYPYGFCFDQDSNLYISDSWNNRIQRWSPNANSGITVAGGNGKGFGQNQFMTPQSVFIADQVLYILDRNNCRVQQWAIGEVTGKTIAGSINGTGLGATSTLLNQPGAIATDSKNNVYVVDSQNSRIQRFAPGSNNAETFANNIIYPNDLKFDQFDNLYVSAEGCNCVLKFPAGSSQPIIVAGANGKGSAPNQFSNPYGLAIDNASNLFVADINNHRVQKFLPGASMGETVAGGNGFGSSDTQLNGPSAIVLDDSLNLFVADTWNDRVQKWPLGASKGITVVGGKGAGATESQLSKPSDLFLDKNGDLFVADTWNNRIQKWTKSSNQSTTIFGLTELGSTLNHLNGPTGVILDREGQILIADEYNHRILKLKQDLYPDTMLLELTAGTYKAKITDTYGRQYESNEVQILGSPCPDFVISATDETCVNKRNGSIKVSANRGGSFIGRISSQSGYSKTVTFSKEILIDSVGGGDYKICISKNNNSNHSACYDLAIPMPKELSVSTSMIDDKTIKIQLSGSNEYAIQLNGQSLVTQQSEITFSLAKGENLLNISTNQSCQKSYFKRIFVEDPFIPYPNPFSNKVTIHIPGLEDGLQSVTIFNDQGVIVEKLNYHSINGRLEINLTKSLKPGLYLFKVKDQIFKMIKG